jgi:hypothetical protein
MHSNNVKVVREHSTLYDIRNYILSTLFASQTAKPNFVFVSKSGGRIDPSQEAGINAWNETIEQQWTHHTFNTIIIRHHLFITLAPEEVTVFLFLLFH